MFDLKFEIRSFWHAGTSRGKAAALDVLVYKDQSGCPCLPGRTVKGLVRDAVGRAEHWDQVPDGLTARLFGFAPEDRHRTRFESEPGGLAFDNARLPAEISGWLTSADDPALQQGFYGEIFATAIDERSGCAKTKSLRGMEVAIPLTLTSRVHVLPRAKLEAEFPEWRLHLQSCLPLIRGLGVGRTRGLGRCIVTMEEVPA